MGRNGLVQDRDKHWTLLDIMNLWVPQYGLNFLTSRRTTISQILCSKELVRK